MGEGLGVRLTSTMMQEIGVKKSHDAREAEKVVDTAAAELKTLPEDGDTVFSLR